MLENFCGCKVLLKLMGELSQLCHSYNAMLTGYMKILLKIFTVASQSTKTASFLPQMIFIRLLLLAYG